MEVDFLLFFSVFYSQRSVMAAWTNPSPWSIAIYKKKLYGI